MDGSTPEPARSSTTTEPVAWPGCGSAATSSDAAVRLTSDVRPVRFDHDHPGVVRCGHADARTEVETLHEAEMERGQ